MIIDVYSVLYISVTAVSILFAALNSGGLAYVQPHYGSNGVMAPCNLLERSPEHWLE